MYSVYIRPLTIDDANISYQWRNNARIWKYTGNRPDKLITPELESAWLADVLKRKNEKRFAICLTSDHTYIGNIYFTDIKDGEAKLHIFIGDIANWGRRRAYEAVELIGEYGFNQMQLNTIYGDVDVRNEASNSLARLLGANHQGIVEENSTDGTLQRWIFTRAMYEKRVRTKTIKEKNQ
jgi:diamine N-acetyltransferase